LPVGDIFSAVATGNDVRPFDRGVTGAENGLPDYTHRLSLVSG
jgi:hypothetical protein